MRSLIIKIAVCTFLLGVGIHSMIEVPGNIIIILISWSVCIAVFRYKNIKILFLCIVILFICIGYIRANFAVPSVNSNSVHYYQSEYERRTLRGAISENPDRRREKVNYIIEIDEIFLDGASKKINGRILISSNLYPAYDYGDHVEINGLLKEPAEFEGFSYKNYLSLFSVYSVMYYPRISLESKGHGSALFSLLFETKRRFEVQLNRLFPEPMASFEAGLLTGSRKGIPDDLMQNFNLTGLTHIIAISGYNISLIIILISSLFRNVSRRVKIPVIIVIIIVFTLFVGASAAVVRASVMGIISVLALWFGRQSQVINALLLSAFFMVMWNPQTLLYDVGFQLSFLATLGLIITGNTLQRIFSFLPEVFGLQEAFAMTLSAQIFALPVILMNFKRLSLISPIANICVVPFIPFAMLFGFLAAMASFINFSFGFILSLPAWLLLKGIVIITQFLAELPFASFETQWFSKIYLIGYYLLFILLAYFIYPYFRKIFLFR